jgi:hypothetical protein
MMDSSGRQAPESRQPRRPVAVLGAGDLVSHLHRGDDERNKNNYRFNLFRLDGNLKASHSFHPNDLRDLVKLCQVLTFTIADDGWLQADEAKAMIDLAKELDELTKQWSDTNGD